MMRIYADETKPVPRPVYLEVTCEGRAGLFPCQARHTWDVSDEPHPRSPAIRAGWKIDQDGPVYCPDCR